MALCAWWGEGVFIFGPRLIVHSLFTVDSFHCNLIRFLIVEQKVLLVLICAPYQPNSQQLLLFKVIWGSEVDINSISSVNRCMKYEPGYYFGNQRSLQAPFRYTERYRV